MTRWVRVQTDVFDHAVFAREPFTEREAWLWLISKAAWKDTKHRIGQSVVDVPVGSVFLTLREMQAAWRWRSDKRVRSFLSMLENEEMIGVKTEAGKTQISVCNYSRYQDAGRAEDASGTQAGRKRDALKTPVHQDTNSEDKSSSSSAFERFWSLFPNKVGKRDAEKAFVAALKRAPLEAILAGVERYVAKTDDRPWCNPTTFLNQDRWADQPAPTPKATAPPKPKTIGDVFRDDAKRMGLIPDEQPHSPPERLATSDRSGEGGGTGIARRFALPSDILGEFGPSRVLPGA